MPRRTRRRAGFIYIVGWRVLNTREPQASDPRRKCPNCKVADARLIGRVKRAWFTMFFIPILPLDSAERTQRISQCRECLFMFDMPIEQLARKAGAMSRGELADTFAVYNDLREHPNDGTRLFALLKMYQQLQELGEAEAAAATFPPGDERQPRLPAASR